MAVKPVHFDNPTYTALREPRIRDANERALQAAEPRGAERVTERNRNAVVVRRMRYFRSVVPMHSAG